MEPVAARDLQRSARIDNNYILKIPNEIAARRITELGNQAAASAAHLSATYSTARNLEVGVEAILRDLSPSTEQGSHKRFEDAMEKVGLMLGFASSRPDKESGIGPDNFWAVGNDRYWVIEVKSEATADEVSRDYLEQLSHSVDWFEGEYAESRYTSLPVMVLPSRRPMWDAVPRQGARVMTFDKLEAFRAALRGFATAIASADGYRTGEIVRQNLVAFGLNAGQLEQRWTEEFLPPSPRPA